MDAEPAVERASDDGGFRDGENVFGEPELADDGNGALLHLGPIDGGDFLFGKRLAESGYFFEPARGEDDGFAACGGVGGHAVEACPFGEVHRDEERVDRFIW